MIAAKRCLLLFSILLCLLSCTLKEVIPPGKPAKIAVVLGAGASRGFSHIGVLKVLESQKVPIHMIVGTSVGSFVGSLYAYGYDAYALQKMALALEKDDLADLIIPDNGFIKGEKLETYVNRALRNTSIERLRIPFYVVTTDIQTGEEMVFGMGNTGLAVRASCSIPGVFKPPVIAGRTYVDGGVVDPVAVDVARRYGADVVIAVDISSGVAAGVPQGTIDTILKSIDIMYAKISAAQVGRADVVIRPKVGGIGSGDFSRRHEAIMEGEKATIDALPGLQKILVRLRQEGRIP